jgi:hypothetical protein
MAVQHQHGVLRQALDLRRGRLIEQAGAGDGGDLPLLGVRTSRNSNVVPLSRSRFTSAALICLISPGALGLSILNAAPVPDSTRSTVMPLARSAEDTSMQTVMPFASQTTSCASRGARPSEALKRASIDSLRSLPGERSRYSRMRLRRRR